MTNNCVSLFYTNWTKAVRGATSVGSDIELCASFVPNFSLIRTPKMQSLPFAYFKKNYKYKAKVFSIKEMRCYFIYDFIYRRSILSMNDNYSHSSFQSDQKVKVHEFIFLFLVFLSK